MESNANANANATDNAHAETIEQIDVIAMKILETLTREACVLAAEGTIADPQRRVLTQLHAVCAIQLVAVEPTLVAKTIRAAETAIRMMKLENSNSL